MWPWSTRREHCADDEQGRRVEATSVRMDLDPEGGDFSRLGGEGASS